MYRLLFCHVEATRSSYKSTLVSRKCTSSLSSRCTIWRSKGQCYLAHFSGSIENVYVHVCLLCWWEDCTHSPQASYPNTINTFCDMMISNQQCNWDPTLWPTWIFPWFNVSSCLYFNLPNRSPYQWTNFTTGVGISKELKSFHTRDCYDWVTIVQPPTHHTCNSVIINQSHRQLNRNRTATV